MAKKKKPAANPARGFATTSIASKPKAEKPPESAAILPKEETPVSLPVVSSAPKEDSLKHVPQTPEELEAQLERDELQLLVEKHIPNTLQ
jgi:ATP-dependent RNA helicase DHX29